MLPSRQVSAEEYAQEEEHLEIERRLIDQTKAAADPLGRIVAYRLFFEEHGITLLTGSP